MNQKRLKGVSKWSRRGPDRTAVEALPLDMTVGLLPVLNEADTVREVIDGVLSLGVVDRLLVIDDNSTDGTLAQLDSAQRQWPQLDVIIRRDEKGLGSALLYGLGELVRRYDFGRVVVLDADLSHDPKAIPELLRLHADLVVGSRYMPGGRIENWRTFRRLVSVVANRLARGSLRLPVRDVTSGFRVYSRPLAKTIVDEAACGGYEFQVETVWLADKHHYTLCETPISFVDRRAGRSKLATPKEVLKFARFVISKSLRPKRWRTQTPGGTGRSA